VPRPQFSIRTLLVAMLAVAAFFGGMVVQRKIEANRLADPNNPSQDIVWFTAAPDGKQSRAVFRRITGEAAPPANDVADEQ
jgi:hypothetical protein